MSYVQNAARDGAAVWILTEIVDRSVRVWENIAGVRVRVLSACLPVHTRFISYFRPQFLRLITPNCLHEQFCHQSSHGEAEMSPAYRSSGLFSSRWYK